ncbi:hypothetical protein JMJ35_010497 [Cladonia borealis]|uniref:FAD-binding domain-containing protein n=1 Tax=Cladonia borealis TaxID=184061 RepID=A0AA39QRE3_9LECA|nr:hypothetical protein JMJ35_010497 [Cladonia borealis]
MTSTPTTTPQSPSISIAVVGGGIAGLCLTLGLLKHPHIDVHVYEAAPTFSEFGAGVEIGPNAQTALRLLSPLAERAFTETTTGNLWPSHENIFCDYIIGVGENEGKLLCAQKCETGMQSMHRARFLDKLVEGIPQERAHLQKRLIKIEDKDSDGGVILHFKDGTTAVADAVIGAEGIRSVVREHILGPEYADPVFSNSIVYRNIRPMDVVIEKLGAEYAQKATILCGPKRGFLSDRIENGHMANLAALIFEVPSWDYPTFHVPAKREELDILFAGWGEKVQALVELMDTPHLTKWAIHSHPPSRTPTYVSPLTPCALIGDAAHAMPPYAGSGAGQAIEDALILSHALSLTTHPSQLHTALKAYDSVRRPSYAATTVSVAFPEAF